jgi:tetratricopeptide (TPR) repeat protein
MDEYAQALVLDQQTVDRTRHSVGADDSWQLRFVSNLAASHRMMGDVQQAAELDLDTYERRRRILGEDHPYTAFSAGSYGRDLRDLGRFEESRTWLEHALTAYRHILGEDHPDTLRAAKNLAVTLRRLARFPEAHALILDTQGKTNAKLGPEHPDSLLCQMVVATTFSSLNLHDRAVPAAKGAVRELTTLLGKDHFYTLLARNNLAAVQLRAGQPQVEDMEAVKQALSVKLLEGHWILAVVSLNLANQLAEAGRRVDALFLDEQTYEWLTEHLGSDHTDTIAAAINLAISQKDNEQNDRAEDLMSDASHRGRDPIGPNHPRAVAARTWRRWTFTFIDPPPLI